jgi:RND family efflux transporter MFP subunit
MVYRTAWGVVLLSAMLMAAMVGCKKAGPSSSAPSLPVVPVSKPVQRQVSDYVEYTGRIDARQSVGIKARATGFLASIGMDKDGKDIKEGSEVRAWLKLTDPAIATLKSENVPESVLAKLNPLKNKEYSQDSFEAEVRKLLNADETKQYLSLVLNNPESKQGDLLFQIDPRPYQYQLAQAKSQVTVVEKQLKLAQITLARDKDSFSKGAGSQQQVDQDDASVAETQARLDAAKTTVKTYELNLTYASVTAPISGQISRFYYTPGNLIVQDQTLLTTIVDVEKVYAYFDMDERTLLKINGQVSSGKIKPPVGTTKVLMSLEGEIDYPHSGILDFVNNVVNPATGTISVRGIFDNPKSANGTRLLVPGMFVRIRLPVGDPHPGLLVVDRAISSDQGLKYVYVVDAANMTQYRRVLLGALQDDGLRVIEPYKPAVAGKEVESGLKPDEWVVVGSLPQLHPKMEISPQEGNMPTPGAPSSPPSQPPTPGDKK